MTHAHAVKRPRLAALVLAGIGLWRGLRGAVIRTLALALLVLALANPVVMQEDREALSTVVPVIVDRSQSQESGERTAETDAALEGLKERFSHYPRIESRIVEAGDDGTSDTPSTRLFDALNSAIADVPGGSSTHGCFEAVKIWISGGKRSGSSSVPTRTKLMASPTPL